jgi:uncharacterized protein YggT (Ycf19 family)
MAEERTRIISTDPDLAEVDEVPRSATNEVIRTTPAETEVRTTRAPYAGVDQVDAVAYDPYANRRVAAYRLTQLIYWVFGLIEGLIAVRLVLRALGANPSAGFAEFIYGVTAPLVAPFVGLFSNPQTQGSVLEFTSIVALIVYALIAWLLARLAWILVGENRSAVHTRSSTYETRVH